MTDHHTIATAGLLLTILSIFAMAACAAHPKFGTSDAGAPHPTTILAGVLWLPLAAGILTVWAGVALFFWRYVL